MKILEVLRDLQTKNPELHIGGSIGLMLHGIDLKRDLSKSDLDFTSSKDKHFSDLGINNVDIASSPTDYNFCFRHFPEWSNGPRVLGGRYVKIEIRIDENQLSSYILHDGFNYRVTDLDEILKFKSIYAVKGITKHIDDFITIATNIRPNRSLIESQDLSIRMIEEVIESDDLPF